MASELVTEVLAEIDRQLSGRMTVWPYEKDEVVHAALERLKEASPETAVGFVLAGLRLMREGERGWPSVALNSVVGGVLRRKLPFTEDQVVEMIERVSVEHREFPFAGVLKAAEPLTMTPPAGEFIGQCIGNI